MKSWRLTGPVLLAKPISSPWRKTPCAFVEVKTRSNAEKGFPAEAVDAKKRERYERIAACYLATYENCDIRVRFDVISILVLSENRAFLRFHKNAFGVE